MPLADYCKFPVAILSPDRTVLEAAQLMQARNVGSVVITDQDRPIGILTDRDIVLRITAQKKDASSIPVRDVMSREPVVVSEDLGIWELIHLMKKHAVRRFPIVSGDGKLVGIITLDDLIKLMGEELSGLGQAIASELGHTMKTSAL